MADVCGCGNEIVPPDPEQVISAPAGWCAPAGAVYDLPEPTPLCSDCEVRLHLIMQIGIDPGPDGEYLRVKRGGIQYPR